MELLFWVFGIIWLIGWTNEMATAEACMRKHEIEYPHDGVKYAVPIILLFAWPYFYFYKKALK